MRDNEFIGSIKGMEFIILTSFKAQERLLMYGVFLKQCYCNLFQSQFWLHISGKIILHWIHTEKSNKMQQCIKIYYSIFIWSSTCFGRHTAHHQEPKTALAVSGFAYVEGCWTLWLLDADSVQQPSTYAKPEVASAVLDSWWWAVCRPKHVELHINME